MEFFRKLSSPPESEAKDRASGVLYFVEKVVVLLLNNSV